jgi:hypothetical protein
MTLRYSFPYYGNYLPSSPATSDNFASSTTTTKRTISTTIDVGNHHGPTINTSTFSTTMVHSFTDDFYQYQVIKVFHSLSLYLQLHSTGLCWLLHYDFSEGFTVYISILCALALNQTKYRRVNNVWRSILV